MDNSQPDPAAEDSPAPEVKPDPKRHTPPTWLEHSYTPQSTPDPEPSAPPPRPAAVQPSEPDLESSPLPRPGSFQPAAPLATTLAETRATLRALAAGSARGYDMEEYRLDVETPPPPDEAEPRWLTPESGHPSGAASPVLSVSRLRSLPNEPEDQGFRSSWRSGFLERVRSDPRLQLIVLACLLVLALVPLLVRKSSETPVSQIRKHPQRFDGQVVTVQGRVGEVFSMGGSHVYYLHQGKDTLLVFTRTGPPLPRQKVTVKGSVSTGYLEGVPRVALFDAGP